MAPHANQRRSRDGEDFVPSVSHPYREQECELCSVHTQRHLDKLFPRAQISTYQIVVMLPVFATREETADCEKILGSTLEDAMTSIHEMVAQCEERCQATGITSYVKYTDAVRRKVRLYTPEVGAFLAVLLSYDKLMGLLDTLWFNRVFPREQRDEALRRANTLLAGTVKDMARLQVRATTARERFRNESRDAKRVDDAKAKAKAAAKAHGGSDVGVGHNGPVTLVAVPTNGSVPRALVAVANNGASIASPIVAETDVVERPRVTVHTDENGVPRVMDSVDGEFPGEHLDDASIDEASGQVDAAAAALDAAGKPRVRKSAASTKAKAAPRRADMDAAPAMAAVG